MNQILRDVTGSRGEKIAELKLTNYTNFQQPLFRPGFLGEKWPAIDLYVELTTVPGSRPYFFCQIKSTSVAWGANTVDLRVSTKKGDIERLLEFPGPTYLIGVHEPTQRAFIRSVNAGTQRKAISTISVANELTPPNLQVLNNEVRDFWRQSGSKPKTSAFL